MTTRIRPIVWGLALCALCASPATAQNATASRNRALKTPAPPPVAPATVSRSADGGVTVRAVRMAGLLSKLERNGEQAARNGAGQFVEVYPAAALQIWGFKSQGYKGKKGQKVRCELLDAIRKRAQNWLTLPDKIYQDCQKSDDVLDAVIAALVARAKEVKLCEQIPGDDREQAQREGWIALPKANSLAALAARDPSSSALSTATTPVRVGARAVLS